MYKWLFYVFNDDLRGKLTFAVLWRVDRLIRVRRVARLANLTARARRIVATLLAHSATRKMWLKFYRSVKFGENNSLENKRSDSQRLAGA